MTQRLRRPSSNGAKAEVGGSAAQASQPKPPARPEAALVSASLLLTWGALPLGAVECKMTSERPVFRFAPSPNGELHVGHALSALVGYEHQA